MIFMAGKKDGVERQGRGSMVKKKNPFNKFA